MRIIMAAHLKQYGWEYVVVDIQWYAYGAGSMRDKHQYILSANWKWTNTEDCSPVLSVFPRQRAERASASGGLHTQPGAEIRHSYYEGDSPGGGAAASSGAGKQPDGG